MASRSVKKKDHEKLDDPTIERVIGLLEVTPPEKPISKKDACEILNISYNTTRLNKIIEEFKEKKERRKNMFASMKGKPLEPSEISSIVLSFLQGYPISDIMDFTYRSSAVITRVLDEVGVPARLKGEEAQKPAFLPEECVLKEPPKIGSILWSAKYHAACELIQKDASKNRDGSDSYQVYVYEPTENGRRGGFYASQRLEELGSLEHLSKYISIADLTK